MGSTTEEVQRLLRSAESLKQTNPDLLTEVLWKAGVIKSEENIPALQRRQWFQPEKFKMPFYTTDIRRSGRDIMPLMQSVKIDPAREFIEEQMPISPAYTGLDFKQSSRGRQADIARNKAMEDFYRGKQSKTTSTIPPALKAIAQKAVSNVRAWDNKETERISNESGIPMTTADRVNVAKSIFGSDIKYRGTKEQNDKLIEVLKNKAINQMKPNTEHATRTIETAPVSSVPGDWFDEYMNG